MAHHGRCRLQPISLASAQNRCFRGSDHKLLPFVGTGYLAAGGPEHTDILAVVHRQQGVLLFRFQRTEPPCGYGLFGIFVRRSYRL